MNCIEQLVSGSFPSNFPYKYTSEFDASSPWSLCIAFYPETCKLPHTDLKSLCKDATKELDPSIKEFVQAECLRVGWAGTLPKGDTITSFFLKIRLRQTDSICRELDIPPDVKSDEFAYIDGMVRVLKLWRKFSVLNTPSLLTFENMDPEIVFEQFIKLSPHGWDLRQKLEYLIMPYLRFCDRVDIVQSFISEAQNLEDIIGSIFLPELRSSVLQVCLRSSPTYWPLVQQAIDKIVSLEVLDTDITLNSLSKPSKNTLKFWNDLIETARLNKLPAQSFKQLAQWTLASQSTQEALLIRFLSSEGHATIQDINTLRRTVFSKVSESFVSSELVKTCFQRSRFMFLKSNLIHKHPEIVTREALNLVSIFNNDPNDANLQKVLTALELVSELKTVTGGDANIKELKEKYDKLNRMHKQFGIDVRYAMTHTPLENVSRALELDTQTYLRYTDLVNLVGGQENSAKVAEKCVEAALANHNFDVAVEFFDRDFVKPDSSNTAWLAYYQAGKHISPNWDLPRPISILKKQIELLSKALLTCGGSDLLTVLQAWSSANAELSMATENDDQGPSVASSQEPNKPGYDNSRNNPRESHSATDQISNLLVSGISWAIGANQ